MENDKYSMEKHTPIVYLIREYDVPILDAHKPANNSRIDNRIIQVP